MLSVAIGCTYCKLSNSNPPPTVTLRSGGSFDRQIHLHSATVDDLLHVHHHMLDTLLLESVDIKKGMGTCLSQDRSCSNDGGPGVPSYHCLTTVLAEGFGQLITIHQQVVW